MNKSKAEIKAKEEQIVAAKKRILELQKEKEKAAEEASLFRAAQLGPEKVEEYKKLKVDIVRATAELQAWIATQPMRSSENEKKYKGMIERIMELTAKINKF